MLPLQDSILSKKNLQIIRDRESAGSLSEHVIHVFVSFRIFVLLTRSSGDRLQHRDGRVGSLSDSSASPET